MSIKPGEKSSIKSPFTTQVAYVLASITESLTLDIPFNHKVHAIFKGPTLIQW